MKRGEQPAPRRHAHENDESGNATSGDENASVTRHETHRQALLAASG